MDGHARGFDRVLVGVDAPPIHGHAIPCLGAVVLEDDVPHGLVHAGHVPASVDGCRELGSVWIIVHGANTDAGAIRQSARRIEVHLLHARTPVASHVRVGNAAGEVEVGVGVVVRKAGYHGLERRVSPLGHPVGRVRGIRGAPRGNLPIRPRLVRDPIHHVGEVQRLVAGAVVGPGPERSTRSAYVSPDDGVPVTDEEFLDLAGGSPFDGAPVPRHHQQCRHATAGHGVG